MFFGTLVSGLKRARFVQSIFLAGRHIAALVLNAHFNTIFEKKICPLVGYGGFRRSLQTTYNMMQQMSLCWVTMSVLCQVHDIWYVCTARRKIDFKDLEQPYFWCVAQSMEFKAHWLERMHTSSMLKCFLALCASINSCSTKMSAEGWGRGEIYIRPVRVVGAFITWLCPLCVISYHMAHGLYTGFAQFL